MQKRVYGKLTPPHSSRSRQPGPGPPFTESRALGGIPSRFPDLATARKVNIDYPLAAAKAFVETLAPGLGPGKKFRFIYVSGHAVDRDLSKQHRFFNDAIHIKVCLSFLPSFALSFVQYLIFFLLHSF